METVFVSVGDEVQEGDVRAVLDSCGLQSDIAQKTASVSAAQASAQQNLADAQNDLATYRNNLANGYNSSMISAESSVTTAELEVQAADVEVESASIELVSARRNLRDAQRGEGDYEYDGASDSQIRSLRDTVSAREASLDKAQTSLEKAEANLAQARTNMEATEVTSGDSLSTYENKVKSAQLNTNCNDQWIAIQKLQADLESCTITAPVSGTMTAVYATEGASGSGLMFVIQDTDRLKILTNIKEYDIDTVQLGDRVIIKADATGDREFSGTLIRIAPTSTQTTAGETTSSTDAEYEAEIEVTAGTDTLRIGMNTRLSIVTDERQNVFSVPYEAVRTDADGQSYVFVAQDDGSFQAMETGIENSLYLEISADGLADGMQVVRSASGMELPAGDMHGQELPEDIDNARDNEAADTPDRMEPDQEKPDETSMEVKEDD